MAIIVRTDFEHNKQEDNLLQQVIRTDKEVIKYRPETEVYQVTYHPQS